MKFWFVGNNLAADLINTEVINQNNRIELINSEKDVLQWCREASIAVDCDGAQFDLSAVKQLRKSLRIVFEAKIDHEAPLQSAINTINHYLKYIASEKCLSHDEQGNFTLQATKKALSPKQILARISYEASTLLASKHSNNLRRCSNPDCILLFVDVSRSRKRRWCSMETCGNRAKAATHYHKSKT